MTKMDIALRSYVKERNPKIFNFKSNKNTYVHYDRVLVFDTETTTEVKQNLLFGFFQIYERRELQLEGLFYNPAIPKKDLVTLKDFCDDHGLLMLGVRSFIDQVFLPEIYDTHTMCIGFNLPFDLSRIAIHFSEARGRNKGGFSFQLTENPLYPRLTIKHVSSTLSFIRFTNAMNRERGNMRHRKGSNTYRGRFLDLRTLAFALSNRKFTLDSATKKYGCEVLKGEVEQHGVITPQYIQYNIQDVRATYSLYLKLKEEYEKYRLHTPLQNIYSPASLGKAYLKSMGIHSFTGKNPDFPPELLGYIMTTYYGGRSEVKIRKDPTPIAYMDVLSMYPTVNILQDLWKFVICDRIDYTDDTERVKEFIERIDLETLQDKDTWKELQAICLVEPNDIILPVRGHYAEKNTFNIGMNHLSSERPIWYSLSDVISAKLLSGKIPKIVKAIRFVPKGVQYGLRPIEIIGAETFNPENEDLFKTLIERRKSIQKRMKYLKGLKTNHSDEIEELDGQQLILKIITNASSYGMFVEINTAHQPNTNLDIFGLDKFEDTRDKVEQNGTLFNPIMGAFITSASRLILAITERILMDNGETYAFCDTDSMAVPVHLAPNIQEYFRGLNPYNFKAEIFELEDENFNEDTGEKETLYFYGISAKRYVLYNIRDGKPHIRKYSSHGLGYLLNPFKRDEIDNHWHKEIWKDILNIHYGFEPLEDVTERYRHRYAISRLSVTSPEIMKRFSILNEGKSYRDKIKPFNFIMIGNSNEPRKHTLEAIKPTIPFSKDYHLAPYSDFMDYHTGEIMNGIRYWKPMDDVFRDYFGHQESKFDGQFGILQRMRIEVNRIIHIGKESNKLEESNIIGVDENGYQIYDEDNGFLTDKVKIFIENVTPGISRKYGICRNELYLLRSKVKEGIPLDLQSKTLIRLRTMLEALGMTS